jgi:serine/threonine protein kinase
MPFAPPDGTVLVEPLGSGSVFEVAAVRDGGAIVACKRLTPRAGRARAARAAMVREAKVLARARHPSLPALVRVGSDGHGPFVIESLVRGATVRAIVEGWRARGQRVPPRLVAHLAAAAAEALAELHELADEAGPIGFVHGDLGPDHVRMGPLGEARFLDLGAARFAGMDRSLDHGDRGTLPFVAPEVARGEAPPSAAGDVYALAATLLWLATGEPLCEAQGEAAMLLAIGERGLRLDLCDRAAGIPEAGRAAIRDALALDPSSRLTSPRALADAL